MERIEPMLATKITELPAGPEWSFEPKMDGWRIMAAVDQDGVQLISRHGNNVTSTFPTVADQLPRSLPPDTEAVLDAEVIGIERATGRHRAATVLGKHTIKQLVVFDVLRLGNTDTSRWPHHKRHSLLTVIIDEQDAIRRIRNFDQSEPLMAVAAEHDLEGIMAKRRDSRYQPGKRSRDWGKLKFRGN